MRSAKKSGPQLVASRDGSGSTSQPARHPFDVQFGTETGGLIPANRLRTGLPADRHVTAYYGVAPSILRALIRRWSDDMVPARPAEEYLFLDVGAGKGRAMLVAAEAPFRQVIGIELNPDLAATARTNLAFAARPKGPRDSRARRAAAAVHLVEGDALSYVLETVPTLALLFHPFERTALRIFLRNVERSFGSAPGLFDLLYINAEHLALFRANRGFSVLWEGNVAMSTEDHAADLQEIANQKEYGSTGDEFCAIVRFVGRGTRSPG